MHILLVEDDQMVREVTQVFLMEFASVDIAQDAESAMVVYREKRPYDLLIVDYGLPGPTGKDLLETIRAEDYEPKAVFYTGYIAEALSLTSDDFSRLNIADIWTKPINFQGLKERVVATINRGAFAYCKERAYAA